MGNSKTNMSKGKRRQRAGKKHNQVSNMPSVEMNNNMATAKNTNDDVRVG